MSQEPNSGCVLLWGQEMMSLDKKAVFAAVRRTTENCFEYRRKAGYGTK